MTVQCEERWSSELSEETHIVLEQQPDIVNAVTENRGTLNTKTECEPGILLGIIANIPEDIRMNHA